uniref:Uncharacterized protein n=1 Tax=viral metagenome TaxID=1070528 RepID=A0A6M3LJN9_9ZZZZ
MLDLRIHGQCEGQDVVARSYTGTLWLKANDNHGNETTIFVGLEQARQILDVFKEHLGETKPLVEDAETLTTE